jgi:hypothetical protein
LKTGSELEKLAKEALETREDELIDLNDAFGWTREGKGPEESGVTYWFFSTAWIRPLWRWIKGAV